MLRKKACLEVGGERRKEKGERDPTGDNQNPPNHKPSTMRQFYQSKEKKQRTD